MKAVSGWRARGEAEGQGEGVIFLRGAEKLRNLPRGAKNEAHCGSVSHLVHAECVADGQRLAAHEKHSTTELIEWLLFCFEDKANDLSRSGILGDLQLMFCHVRLHSDSDIN